MINTMRLILMSILIFLGTAVQAQNVGIKTNNGDTLFIRVDMYDVMVKSWDTVINEPKPTFISVEDLSVAEEYIYKCEKNRIRAEKWDRHFEQHRYFLFFTIDL